MKINKKKLKIKPQNNSYEVFQFQNPKQELKRLRLQAEVFSDLEIKALQQSGLNPTDHVVEIGCGVGYFSKTLLKIIPQGHLYGVEIDPNALDLWKQNIHRKSPLNTTPLSIQKNIIPLSDNSCDFIYCRFLLQHVADPSALLRECHRILKPRGHICCLDSDDGLILHHPKNRAITQLLDLAYHHQLSKGGNRKVGRELVHLLLESQFTNTNAKIEMFNSTQIPEPLLRQLLFGQKISQIPILSKKQKRNPKQMPKANNFISIEKNSLKKTLSIENLKTEFLAGGVIFVSAKKSPTRSELGF